MVNLLKKCWISDAAWRKSICFGLVFVVTLAVLGHDLQGEMTFSQSRLLCTLLFYVQMITSLKLGLLHKIGQKHDKSFWKQLQLHLLSSGQVPALQIWVSRWGGRAGRWKSATRPFARPGLAGAVAAPSPDLPQHSWARAKEPWEVPLASINRREFSLRGSRGKHSIIGL